MKEKFEGIRYEQCPEQWDQQWNQNIWLQQEQLYFESHWDKGFRYVVGEQYKCFEIPRKMNVFTFGKWRLDIPIILIGLPVSIDGEGYAGNLQHLIADYRKRKGLFLILNLHTPAAVPLQIPIGRTLGTCLFANRFESFEHYFNGLRSSYRRRIKQAMEKGQTLCITEIENGSFDQRLYDYYRQVLSRSKYPLETLPIEFFQRAKASIYVLSQEDKPLAFVMLKVHQNTLYFMFGGMAYEARDTYDLYMNMLLFIIKTGIEQKVETIHFGQTAEKSKGRIGATLVPRYMCVFTRNAWLNRIISKVMPYMEYESQVETYKVFHDL